MFSLHYHHRRIITAVSISFLLLLFTTTTTDAAVATRTKSSNSVKKFQRKLLRSIPKLNLKGFFGSPQYTAKTPYELVGSTPVFMVGTQRGNPYLSSVGDQESGVVYYMDIDDAKAALQEFKRNPQSAVMDASISSTSLSKAIRQSAQGESGLPTGHSPDPMTGHLDDSTLIYKIIPSHRQLFYACRCKGRASVGQSRCYNSLEDAHETMKEKICRQDQLVREQERLRTKGKKKKLKGWIPEGDSDDFTDDKFHYVLDKMRATSKDYNIRLGIPTFYCPNLKREVSRMNNFGRGEQENVLFLSYEDLQSAWAKVRVSTARKEKIMLPKIPPNVEVMNLMDVLTSMDREDLKKKSQSSFEIKAYIKEPLKTVKNQMNDVVEGTKNMFHKKKSKNVSPPDISKITFVPESRGVEYLHQIIAARGSRSPRMRPMREWRNYFK